MLSASLAPIDFSAREEAETDPMSERLAKRIQEEFIPRIMLMEWNWIVALNRLLLCLVSTNHKEWRLVSGLNCDAQIESIFCIECASVEPVEKCV